ncbi:MAG TPA: type II toxin-antitoxin system VapC family toxin [Phycisphaerae bacterium]|nr:type II toxin-antitoxin system VapC family toxin [Phycisphaerae bacterium]
MLNLDTHILLHAFNGSLSRAERKLLSGDSWSISAIVLWEIAKLIQRGRIVLDIESADFQRHLARIHVWPIDLAIAQRSIQLDFRGDPADELIAATSIVHAVPLITRDRQILASAIVPLAIY